MAEVVVVTTFPFTSESPMELALGDGTAAVNVYMIKHVTQRRLPSFAIDNLREHLCAINQVLPAAAPSHHLSPLAEEGHVLKAEARQDGEQIAV